MQDSPMDPFMLEGSRVDPFQIWAKVLAMLNHGPLNILS